MVTLQLPDPETSPQLHQAITSFMLHGPCGEGKACWKNDCCRFGYPCEYVATTTITDDTYPNYARPDNGCCFSRNGCVYTNKDVVPTNIYLILKYMCYINVEIPISIKALKYLYKYIKKCQDWTTMSLTANDEINCHVDGRFLAAHEGECLSFFF